MEFDQTTVIGAFLLIVAIGVVGLIVGTPMERRTVLMMVLPSMVLFGGISMWLGVQLGEHRAAH